MKTIKTRKQAIEYLNMYFEFNTELRTIINDDTNIITKNNIEKYTTKQLIIASEDAQYEIKCEIGYLL
jgi:hypothetical protein